MPENRPHPHESSSARGNQYSVAVDLRNGQARRLPDQSSLRDAVIASRKGKQKAGVTVLSGRA